MEKIKVLNMNCNNCVNRISKALEKDKIDFEISLVNKELNIDEKDKEVVVEILDDLGFEIKQ
ncbi:MAG: heavy metal-associated domain-containing protein [Erysipelotrichaceae bacterium]